MADPGPASFLTRANALLRKNITFLKQNIWSNVRLIMIPISLCILLVVIQVLVDTQVNKSKDNQCGCQCIDTNGDGKCEKACGFEHSNQDQARFCSIPNPSRWTPLLQIPLLENHAVRELPDDSCRRTETLLGKTFRHYSVVIDAGSSGTRVHVFEYWFKAGKPRFDFGKEHYANLMLSPGLSSYADNPDGASDSVTKLVEFAKGRIPKRKWKKSDVRLMATAGMRLLTPPVQEQILEVTRIVLRSSGLLFRDEWATVITGSDEGVYAWIAANFALGSLGSDPLETTGIVELGGASAQVTFVAKETLPLEYSRKILYGNVSYTIYSHSFLNYGKDAARRMLLESLENSVANSTEDVTVADPCTPKGYIYEKTSQEEVSGFLTDESKFKGSLEAAGNFSKCRSATYALLQNGTENCPYKHCSIGPTFTPDLRGSFLATSNFFYVSEFFWLEEKGWLPELITAGKKYCADEWSKIKLEYPNEKEEYLRSYCFASAYIISMLHDSLGIALDDERITYASKAGAKNIPLDWALGALILDAVTQISGYSATF